jgi:hypothetical protein
VARVWFAALGPTDFFVPWALRAQHVDSSDAGKSKAPWRDDPAGWTRREIKRRTKGSTYCEFSELPRPTLEKLVRHAKKFGAGEVYETSADHLDQTELAELDRKLSELNPRRLRVYKDAQQARSAT